MGLRWRRVIGAVVFAGALTWFAGGTAGVASARIKPPPSASSWQLVDYAQRGCFSTRVHDTYFGIWINGTWTRSIDVGAAGLPAGATFDTSYAPIPPGSSSGIYSLAYVHVIASPSPPIGTYTAWLWASDGVTTRQVPVTIDSRVRCGSY